MGAVQHGNAAERRGDNQDNACYISCWTHFL